MRYNGVRNAIFLLMVLLAGIHCQLQTTVYDKEYKILIGSKDDFSQDTRIEQSGQRSEININLNDKSLYLKNLGLKDWGVVQVSALMTTYPNLKGPNVATPFCSVTEETTSFNKKAFMNLDNDHNIMDFEVYGNSIFMLISTGLMFKTDIVPVGSLYQEQRSSQFTNEVVETNLMELSKKETGKPFSVSGMAHHKAQNTLYIPTDNGLIIFKVKNSEVQVIAKDVYQGFSKLVYTDIVDDLLFVAFEEQGIFVYNIAKQDHVTLIGKMDAKYFSKSVDKRLSISSFVVHNHLVEIEQALPSDLTVKPWADKEKAIFTNEDTLQKYIDTMVERNRDETLMFVAESEGIYIIDLKKIRKTNSLANTRLPHVIPLTKVHSLKRFDATLYALRRNLEDSETILNGVRSELVEIFIMDRKGEDWTDFTTDKKNLFEINRRVDYFQDIHNIYVDDVYFYAIGDGSHFYYERGVPKEYGFSNYAISECMMEADVESMVKFIIRGENYLITIGKKHLADFKMTRTDPHIKCPAFDPANTPLGYYEIDLNVTTRSCPVKAEVIKDLSNKAGLKKLCKWQTTLKINYNQISITEDAHTLSYLLVFLLLVKVLCCTVIVYFVCHMRKVNAEYDRLKNEIGNIRLPSENIQSARVGSEMTPSNLGNPEGEKMGRPTRKAEADNTNEGDNDQVDYADDA